MTDAHDGTGIRRKKRVVAIIGAGYAGVMAANRVGSSLTPEEAEKTELVIINPGDAFIERIRLHEVAAGTIPTAALPLSTVLHPGVRLLEGAAVRIDPRNQAVAVRTGTEELALHYDFLVYAAGSSAASTVPGAGTYAYALADAGGALGARAAIRQGPPGQHILIVGGGYTSIEAASEIAEQHPDAAVTLLCGGELAGSMTLHARTSIRRSLERLNINVRQGARVSAVTAQGVVLESGERIGGDVCIWAASFTAPGLAALSGLATDPAGRLRVDSCLRSTEYPNIIGAGDAAVLPSDAGAHLRMGCAAALPMGSFAARTVLARLRDAEPEPASIGYLLQCLSLGRLDSYIQIVGPDDSPRRLRFRGRTGAWIKEAICRMTLRALRNELIRPGSYKAPKGPRINPPLDVSAPSGPGR